MRMIDKGLNDDLSGQLLDMFISQLSFLDHFQAKNHVGYCMSHQKDLSVAAFIEEFYSLE